MTPQQAQRRVFYAVQTGKLKREPCEVCGATRVDAHHTDYERPLDVQWLCRLHHKQAHALTAGDDLSGRIRTTRYEQGRSQLEVATAANVSVATMRKAEHGADIRVAPLLRIIAALGESRSYVLDGAGAVA